jgi:predicted transcriptional regulator
LHFSLDDNCRHIYIDDSRRQNGVPLRKVNIGQAELEVLRYIQDHHPISVRDVAAHFARTKGHVRTTTLNVMGRLVVKGQLKRRRVDGVYQYEPRHPKGDMLRGLVGDFVHRTLGGSLTPFVAYLAEDAELSETDLAELRLLVERLEANPGKKP